MNSSTKKRYFIPMGFGILTVSDSRKLSNDKSGDILEERILNAGHSVISRALVKDDKVSIKKMLKKWIVNNNLDVYSKIIPCGLDNKKITSLLNEKGKIDKNIEQKIKKIFMKNINKI